MDLKSHENKITGATLQGTDEIEAMMVSIDMRGFRYRAPILRNFFSSHQTRELSGVLAGKLVNAAVDLTTPCQERYLELNADEAEFGLRCIGNAIESGKVTAENGILPLQVARTAEQMHLTAQDFLH